MNSPTDTAPVVISDETARDTIALLHMVCTGGIDPTTWSDDLRAGARLLMEVYEEALCELVGEGFASVSSIACGPVERHS